MEEAGLETKGAKGNRGYSRARKFDSPEDFKKAVEIYLQWVEDNPHISAYLTKTGEVVNYPVARYPAIGDCGQFLGVSRGSFHGWGQEGHRLKEAMEWAENLIHTKQIELVKRRRNPISAIAARKLDLAEKVHGTGSVTGTGT